MLGIRYCDRIGATGPLGIYQGKPNANTRRLIVEEGGFLYDSDSYADDLPYGYFDSGLAISRAFWHARAVRTCSTYSRSKCLYYRQYCFIQYWSDHFCSDAILGLVGGWLGGSL